MRRETMQSMQRLTMSGGVLVVLLGASTARAQCPQAEWLRVSTAGMSSNVNAVTTWDPDGDGPLAAQIIAGGLFTSAGGQTGRTRVARWDGSAWQPFGTGMNSAVRALTSWDPDGDGPIAPRLVAGGDFDSAGGVSASRIASWDGSAWQPFGAGMSGANGELVYALTTWDPDGAGPVSPQVVAGGQFNNAGGVFGVNKIARWDGSAWQRVGPGFSDWVRALTTWDPDGDGPLTPQIVAGGDFINVDMGATVNRIARWDGTAWQPFGTGMSGQVYSLTTWDPDGDGPLAPQLVAGGGFTTADGVTVNRIARWDGTTWQPFGTGTGMNSNVLALATWAPVENGPEELVAGGIFTTAEGATVNCITRWDGAAWQPFGTGMDNNRQVFALTTWDPDGAGTAARQLVVGGGFTFANDVSGFNRIARYTPAGAVPDVTSQPADAATCSGGTAEFSVTATGAPLTYSWRKDGTPIDTMANPSAATATLVLSVVSTFDAGAYDCLVTNACGSDLSDAATLAVCDFVADVNCDAAVDLTDLATLLSNFGLPSGVTHAMGDLDGDTDSDLTDLSILLGLFGTTCP